MPLLAGRWAPLASAALLVVGCFEEPSAGTTGETDTTASSSSSGGPAETGDSTADPTVDPTVDPSGGGCLGCLDAAGGCLAGDLDEACGALAEACVACEAGTYCDEGSCTPLPACTPDDCEGCCDGDTCLEGTAVDACGRDGQQCSACSGESTCNEGSCELPCATTCDGCCDASGDCIPADQLSDTACGSQGASCESCDDGFACSSGSCISTACQSTCEGCCDGDACNPGDDEAACGQGGSACEPCPVGTLCADTCEADPNALWSLVIDSATTTTSDPNGSAWDALGGLPDPYVEVTLDGVTASTPVDSDTITPAWNVALFEGSTTDQMLMPITYELWDQDVTIDESMGACTFQLTPDLFGEPLQADCLDDDDDVQWTLYLSVVAM